MKKNTVTKFRLAGGFEVWCRMSLFFSCDKRSSLNVNCTLFLFNANNLVGEGTVRHIYFSKMFKEWAMSSLLKIALANSNGLNCGLQDFCFKIEVRKNIYILTPSISKLKSSI